MKKCITCGFENDPHALICEACQENLDTKTNTNDFHQNTPPNEEITAAIDCDNCRFPFMLIHTYLNCPYCNHTLNSFIGDEAPSPHSYHYKEIKLSISVNATLLGELTIDGNVLSFHNSGDYPLEKRLTVINPLRPNNPLYFQSFGKTNVKDSTPFDTRHSINFLSEDGFEIKIDLK